MSKFKYLFNILKENEIEKLQVAFDGYGDDGNMHFLSVESKNDKKIDEVLNYQEHSPNSFLDEPIPIEILHHPSRGHGTERNLSNLLWDVVYEVFEKTRINWCEGRGNKGCVEFDILKEKINLKYMKWKNAEIVVDLVDLEGQVFDSLSSSSFN
jgi:hypothetical protein